MKINLFLLTTLGSVLLLGSCRGSKEEVANTQENQAVYRSTVPMVNDLQHTKLELEPDFEKKELKGIATLIIKPHFSPVDSLVLDAKNMRIESVVLLKGKLGANAMGMSGVDTMPLNYSYDLMKLRMQLDRRYVKDETYTVRIEYVAMPETAGGKGSKAITDNKGVYFIQPDSTHPDKPVQIWTQGETEAASCWFPTIDAPNQKTSQELSITIPNKFKTVSNGKYAGFEYELRNGNDTFRTDFWVQDKPHAPYLFAMAIGEFAEVRDYWHDMPVYYYVEPAYQKYAKMVFGNTPEMLEFYSSLLKTPYPWDKYHQVVVRDFVSGAMENTGCVIHYSPLQHNFREHQDNTNEDIIAHELFHHWFGDLVTCESWSNVPLNESFATYGEYLWFEHKYGRDEADGKLQNFRQSYLDVAEDEHKLMIRYDYTHQEEMFDVYSYQKGGMILHALRKELGDEVFFESLRVYLDRHKYKSVELADLRLCFEEVSGLDLNWFFEQWFFKEGHPELNVKQTREGNIYKIFVSQNKNPYRLKFNVSIGVNRNETLVLTRDSQTFVFKDVKPEDMVAFDGENQLLGELHIDKSVDEWKNQFAQSKLAFHKIEAFEALMTMLKTTNEKAKLCAEMLEHPYHECRSIALNTAYYQQLTLADLEPMRQKVLQMSKADPKSTVRYEALMILSKLEEQSTIEYLLNDSSYIVSKRAMLALGTLDKNKAYTFADTHRGSNDPSMRDMAYLGVGLYSNKDELPYFMDLLRKSSRKEAHKIAYGLNRFVTQNRKDLLQLAMDSLAVAYRSAKTKLERGNYLVALISMRNSYMYEMYMYEYYMGISRKNKAKYKKSYKKSKGQYEYLDKFINQLKEQRTELP